MVRYLVQWKNGEEFTNHGFFRTSQQAFESIQDWWELNSFKPNYVRILGSDDTIKAIDYGSYTSFYYIIPVTEESFGDFLINGIEAHGMNVNWNKYKSN